MYTLSNDAYGTPTNPKWCNNGAQNWTSKAGYSNWKTDYLWLPSVAEVVLAMVRKEYGQLQLNNEKVAGAVVRYALRMLEILLKLMSL